MMIGRMNSLQSVMNKGHNLIKNNEMNMIKTNSALSPMNLRSRGNSSVASLVLPITYKQNVSRHKMSSSGYSSHNYLNSNEPELPNIFRNNSLLVPPKQAAWEVPVIKR
jgi:hypothetical protein